MVHKFKNKVDNFLFSEMPIDSMDYERKGGCFVTISKGVILTVIFVIFGFILGLLVFYTTKHAYQNVPSPSLEEFILNLKDNNDESIQDSLTPKHYRIILNPLLYDVQNPYSFNGNVWITITANDENTKTIELDATNLDIFTEDVSVYRSRILSDSDFDLENHVEKRSAQLIEDDISIEDDQFDILMNSTEVMDSNATTSVEKESQELISETDDNATTTEAELNESEVTEVTEMTDETELTEESSDPSVTEPFDYNNTSIIWDGLQPNDTILLETNPDDQTELQIDDIQFDTDRRKIIITLNLALRKGHYYIVKVFFRGKMSDENGLVYKGYDGMEANDSFIAATLTEPDYTSAVFPCFNNFLKEVTFELNLIRHTNHQSVAVSKLIRSQKITNDWTLDVYQRTSPMKLNDFGFAITNIEAIIITATPNLLLNSYFRPNLLPSITFIDSEIPQILNNFEMYTNITYPMESISFIGLPKSSNDVIELKQGLVIASESLFLPHDEADKLNKAAIIAHLIGKLWSQTLATHFQGQEWITEGLPMQLRLISSGTQTDNYYNSESMVEKRMESMRKEQGFIEFNLEEYYKNRFDENWNEVAQSKGLYLLAIIENLLTEPTYKMGVQQFFKSKGPLNFLETVTNLTSNTDQSMSMEQSIREWSQQIGYPLIHITKYANNVQIQETEFGNSNSSQFWITPITINNQIFWLTKNAMNFDIEDSTWLIVKSNGYFRVNYDGDHWQTILNALKMDHKVLSTIDRSILMDDAFNLAKCSYLNYSIIFKLLESWNEKETEYLPWKAALGNLEFVYRNAIDLPVNSGFGILLRNLTQRAYQNIVRSPLSGPGGFSYKLKVLIKKWSCQIFALPDCIADSKKDFQSLIINDTLKRSQRSSTDVEQFYCTVIRFGDLENWHFVRDSFDRRDNHDYNKALIYSLGCSSDHRMLNEYYQLLLDKSYKSYAEAMLRSMRDNQLGQKFALEFLYTNFQQLHELHGLHILKILLKSIANYYDYELFQLFFSNNSSLFLYKDKKALAEIVKTIKSTLNWRNNFAKEFND